MEIKQVSWFDDHFYKIDLVDGDKSETRYLPSTTTKLGVVSKPQLARWRGDIGNREADIRMNDASRRGVRIHHACWTYSQGGAVIYNPFERPNYTKEELNEIVEKHNGLFIVLEDQGEMWDVYKFKTLIELLSPEILGAEKIVYSLKHSEAGQVDYVLKVKKGEYEINGVKTDLEEGVYIADLKTGKVIDDCAFMQIADYASMWHECGGEEPIGGLIIHTGATTKKGIAGLKVILRNKEEMIQDYEDFRHVSAVWERQNKNKQPKIFDFPSLITKEVGDEAAGT